MPARVGHDALTLNGRDDLRPRREWRLDRRLGVLSHREESRAYADLRLELSHERGLPHPGFADDGDYPAISAAGRVQPPHELPQLVDTADESIEVHLGAGG